jgi:hypothetical protein
MIFVCLGARSKSCKCCPETIAEEGRVTKTSEEVKKEWQALLDWAAENKSWSLYTVLREDGPDPNVDHGKLLRDFSS